MDFEILNIKLERHETKKSQTLGKVLPTFLFTKIEFSISFGWYEYPVAVSTTSVSVTGLPS